MQQTRKIRVLVVDDSVLMSRQITAILEEDANIEVVGRAKDGVEALSMVGDLNPDVVTLDVEMPRMNGITALKHIMVRHSTPTVMISALTTEGARTTFDALKYGAIDVIAKPSRREDVNLESQKADIVTKVKRAAMIRTGRSRYIRTGNVDGVVQKTGKGTPRPETRVIGIGAGTGGYYSLLRIIPGLSADFSGIVAIMVLSAPRYVLPFIAYLDSQSLIPVRSAHGVTVPERGVCYLCSSEDGLVIDAAGDGAIVFRLLGPGKEPNHGPLDRFFVSLSSVGPRAAGLVLTGGGKDGADGMVAVQKGGGNVFVQDINNCLDPGMALAALEKGAVERIVPDFQLAELIMGLDNVPRQN